MGNPPQSNAQRLNCPDLTSQALKNACLNALTNPDGYDGREGWNAWRGHHRGTWHDDSGGGSRGGSG